MVAVAHARKHIGKFSWSERGPNMTKYTLLTDAEKTLFDLKGFILFSAVLDPE
jgi:hypothetical protein